MSVTGRTDRKQSPWRRTGVKGDVQAALNALHGLTFMVRNERPFRLQLIVSAIYALGAWSRGISHTEWVVSLIAVAIVLVAETTNTAIEMICDFMHDKYNEDIGRIKDAAAALVLIVALATGTLWILFLFYPCFI